MPVLNVSATQRTALRAQAHTLKPVVIVGADGLTDAVLAEVERNLLAHELIKIRVFGDDRDLRIALYDTLCERTQAAPIQHIGKLLVIWRPQPAVRTTPSRRASGNTTPARRFGAGPGALPLPKAAGTRPTSGARPAAGARFGARPAPSAGARPGSRPTTSAGARPGSRPVTSAGARPGSRPTTDARPATGPRRPATGARPLSQSGNAAPRVVQVLKPSGNPMRRPKPQAVVVRGNERLTAGGIVKRTKKRQSSVKRAFQQDK